MGRERGVAAAGGWLRSHLTAPSWAQHESEARRLRRGPALAIILLFALAAAIRLPTLSYPLVEAHAFRQTQTAYTAVIYHETRIDLLHTPLPTLGPPWELPFEFPLFQAVAAIGMNAGATPEMALRGTALVFFLLTGMALVGLLRQFDTRPRTTLLVLGAYLLSPFSFEWSRAATIEYLAVGAGVAGVAALFRFEKTGNRAWLVVGLTFAVVASLVKISTALIWILPFVALSRRRIPAATVAAVALLAGFVWTGYADWIKATGPLTNLFTSANLGDWVFGGIDDRVNPVAWAAWIWHLTPLGLLALPGLVFLRWLPTSATRRLWLICGGVVVVALLSFPTLYARHSYYSVAMSPAIAILVAASLEAALAARSIRYVAITGAVVVVATFTISAPLWRLAFEPADPDRELVSAGQVRAATRLSDNVLIVGRDYSPAILYYAGRRGIALPFQVRLSDLPSDILLTYRAFDCGFDADGDCRPMNPP